MSQNDYSIPDQDGASFLVDLNNALVALASVNKGGTAPATPYDGQVWCDDGGTPWVYKVYSGADQGWRPFLKLDAASGTVTLVGGVELSSALSIAQGGTGATTAESARTALGFTAPILNRATPGDIGGTTPGAGHFATLTSSGNVGIGTTSPKIQEWRPYTTAQTIYHGNNGGVLELGTGTASKSSGAIAFANDANDALHKHIAVIEGVAAGGTTGQQGGRLDFFTKGDGVSTPTHRMIIDQDGNVGIGTTNPLNVVGYKSLTVNAPTSYGYSYIDLRVDDDVSCRVTATPSRSVDVSAEFITFSTGSWEHGTIAERARIDSSGHLLVGTTSGTYGHTLYKAAGVSSYVASVIYNGNIVALFQTATNSGWNTNTAALKLAKDEISGRSIGAAGTINASGADYAEYETKRTDCGDILKGNVVGFDADGLLTDVFATAVSFGIKSTDPSYVGGDVWGTENVLGLKQPEQPVRKEPVTEQRETGEADEAGDPIMETVVIEPGETDAEWQARLDAHDADKAAFDATLEAARRKVDRIAYSGKVPLNHDNKTFAIGDYVVPVAAADGGIEPTFRAVDTLTMGEYAKAVGYVRSVGDDGRPVIAVKVG